MPTQPAGHTAGTLAWEWGWGWGWGWRFSPCILQSVTFSLIIMCCHEQEEEEDEERRNSRVSLERQKTLDRLRNFKQVNKHTHTHSNSTALVSV